jgi:hypothetical protein
MMSHRVHYRSLDTSPSQTELPNQDDVQCCSAGMTILIIGVDFLILVRDLGECVMLMLLLSMRMRGSVGLLLWILLLL